MMMTCRCPIVIMGGRGIVVLGIVVAPRHAQSRVDGGQPLNRDRKDQQRYGENAKKRSRHRRPFYLNGLERREGPEFRRSAHFLRHGRYSLKYFNGDLHATHCATLRRSSKAPTLRKNAGETAQTARMKHSNPICMSEYGARKRSSQSPADDSLGSTITPIYLRRP